MQPHTNDTATSAMQETIKRRRFTMSSLTELERPKRLAFLPVGRLFALTLTFPQQRGAQCSRVCQATSSDCQYNTTGEHCPHMRNGQVLRSRSPCGQPESDHWNGNATMTSPWTRQKAKGTPPLPRHARSRGDLFFPDL